jgi:TusA-related sulfurtransferase
MMTARSDAGTAPFKTISRDSLPEGRKGKHHGVVAQLLKSLEELKDGRALKIPLSELPDTKANIRSALSRASKQKRLNIATASDETHFYVWNVTEP